MKNILVPIDFSANAERAIAAARVVSKSLGAHIYLLHVHQPVMTDVTLGHGAIPGYEEIEASFRDDLKNYVNTLNAEGFSAEGIWETGIVADMVRAKIGELNPELVVIGRTGTGGFMDKLFGTAATDIVKVSQVPVLIVPPQAGKPHEFREIVYATQLEYEERHVIRQVLEFSGKLGGRVTFLKVSSLTQPNVQEDKQFVDEIIAEFGLPEEDFLIREAGSVVGGIEKYARELDADVLVVATRTRGFLERLLIDPSVTNRLIVNTSIPLLVYHLN